MPLINSRNVFLVRAFVNWRHPSIEIVFLPTHAWQKLNSNGKVGVGLGRLSSHVFNLKCLFLLRALWINVMHVEVTCRQNTEIKIQVLRTDTTSDIYETLTSFLWEISFDHYRGFSTLNMLWWLILIKMWSLYSGYAPCKQYYRIFYMALDITVARLDMLDKRHCYYYSHIRILTIRKYDILRILL